MKRPNDVFPSGTKRRGVYLPLLAGPCHLESPDILDRLVELVPDKGTYFELGAWTASTACYIADHRPKATVIAADRFPDPLRAMLALANVKICCLDYEAPSIPAPLSR